MEVSVIEYVFGGVATILFVQFALQMEISGFRFHSTKNCITLSWSSSREKGKLAFCLKKAHASGVAKVRQIPRTPNEVGSASQGYLQRVPRFSR